jgi:hypothetical protein
MKFKPLPPPVSEQEIKAKASAKASQFDESLPAHDRNGKPLFRPRIKESNSGEVEAKRLLKMINKRKSPKLQRIQIYFRLSS